MGYQVSLEISGPTAMWTRPDTGDAPVSYPAPTLATLKCFFHSIVWLKSAGANVAETWRPVRHCR
jgi:CRISPR-associated protein Cas5d